MIEPKVKQIILTRAEGPSSECRKPFTAMSFFEAQKKLIEWGQTAPTMGYDKVDFEVYWDHPNYTSPYTGRYDLKFGGYESDGASLATHIADWIKYLHKTLVEVEECVQFMKDIYGEDLV